MARKLRTEEAEVFRGAMDASKIPTDPETFLQSLLELQEESLELTLIPGMWLDDSSTKPIGS